MKNKTAATSISDIAKIAKVSESTVSRALNDNPLINAETRKRIQNIARDLNYSVNIGARNLRLKRSHAISLVINSDASDGRKFSDPFMLDLIGTIADELNAHNYSLLFSGPSIKRDDWHSLLIKSKTSDGIIVIGQSKNDKNLEDIHTHGDALVVWGAQTANSKYCVVGSDNYVGGEQAANHLMERGCKKLVFLGDVGHPEINCRFIGFTKRLNELGLTSNITHLKTGFSIESGYQVIMTAIKNNIPIDGIFSASDNIAMGAITALQEKGFRIPTDVSVVGFDDIPLAQYFNPPLTTIKQDIHKGGTLLVKKIMSRIAGKNPKSEMLTTQLITRMS